MRFYSICMTSQVLSRQFDCMYAPVSSCPRALRVCMNSRPKLLVFHLHQWLLPCQYRALNSGKTRGSNSRYVVVPSIFKYFCQSLGQNFSSLKKLFLRVFSLFFNHLLSPNTMHTVHFFFLLVRFKSSSLRHFPYAFTSTLSHILTQFNARAPPPDQAEPMSYRTDRVLATHGQATSLLFTFSFTKVSCQTVMKTDCVYGALHTNTVHKHENKYTE